MLGSSNGDDDNDDMDLYLNGYFDTSDKKLPQDMYCTDILSSGNCNNIVKSHDGTVWNFFIDMSVNFQTPNKCIRITKDYTITSSSCSEPIHGVVCRLDCCKFFIFLLIRLRINQVINYIYFSLIP